MSQNVENGATIEARQLVREYHMGRETVQALAGIDLVIHRGEFVGILGVSGSGKSTLLHLLGGLDTPTSGQVLVDGRDLASFSAQQRTLYRRSQVGFIFQSYYLVPRLTAIENVNLALAFQGVFGDEASGLAAEAIERVGLGHRAGHRPNQLSGGEQQRVAVARAIVRRPPLLLADEPTGNLDSATAAEITSLLRRIHDELQTTIVMVTHDQPMAARVSTRLIRLCDGRVVEEGA